MLLLVTKEFVCTGWQPPEPFCPYKTPTSTLVPGVRVTSLTVISPVFPMSNNLISLLDGCTVPVNESVTLSDGFVGPPHPTTRRTKSATARQLRIAAIFPHQGCLVQVRWGLIARARHVESLKSQSRTGWMWIPHSSFWPCHRPERGS